MTKTGKQFGRAISLFAFLFTHSSAFAALQASLDHTQVPQDESVSFKIVVSPKDNLNPKFDAPDFEVMNQFESSQYSSVYNNGHWENKGEKSLTYILRPLKGGTLRIRNISNGGEKAPDLSVQVIAENNYKRNVPGSAPAMNGDNKNFFVKAEVSKARVYKGEQFITSFYLYRRTRANIRDVMQYPSFQGFIREDLEMPILSGRPEFEAVNLGGVPFERALLARYALYPIQDGKLKIDGLGIRADYIPRNAGNDDMMEDPFFQFFTQVTPRTGTSKSDPITVDVLPLPEDGKTQLFTGGVGNFEVHSQLDATAIKANSPLTLHVSVRGKGNANMVEFPSVNWPKEIKFYESQGKSKNIGQGETEKTFEVVLIPLQKGSYEIPPIEFEFFNPEGKSYVRRKTEAIRIQVAEGDPGSTPVQAEKGLEDSAPIAGAPAPKESTSFGGLRVKDPKTEGPSSFLGQPWWRWVAWFGLLVFFCFIGLVAYDSAKKRSKAQLDILRRRQNNDAFWNKLQKEVMTLNHGSASVGQYSPIVEEVVGELYKTLDETYGITSRSHPQRELASLLTENHAITHEQWKKMVHIFEFSEMVRFASGSTRGMADPEIGAKVNQVIEDGRAICGEILGKNA